VTAERASEISVKVAVLGAGPTGIGAAWRLTQNLSSTSPESHATNGTLPFLLLDEASLPGGRAASFITPEGFLFDYGGHVLFPHQEYGEFARLLDEIVPEWYSSRPFRGVWIRGKLIARPVQRNIHRLPLPTMFSCLWGLLRRKVREEDGSEPNLQEYLEEQFGKQLTRHLMGPLNLKMWAYPPNALGSSWSSHHSGSKEKNIPDVSAVAILRNLVLNRDDTKWIETTSVRYPLEGGMGGIWERIFQMIPEGFRRLNTRVVSIDTTGRRIFLDNGTVIRYCTLVTSIPLDVLLRLLQDQPKLQARSLEFRAARVQLYGFGLKGPMPHILNGVHGLNVPAPEVPFWRVTIPSNVSPRNVPNTESTWSILCESSAAPESKTRHTSEAIEKVLRKMSFIPSDTKVVSVFSADLEHGYPVPFVGRNKLLNELQSELEMLCIYSRGRFGGWRYEVSNQDHAFMQGVEIIDRLYKGTPEYTYIKTW
jgi:protoporphyrinogen oxidase